eukprot:gene7688-7517_t
MPVHEQAYLFAAARHRLPRGLDVALADFAAFEQVQSKTALAELLTRLNVPQPATEIVHSASDFMVSRPYPYFVKAAFGTASTGVWRVGDATERDALARELQRHCAFDEGVVVQAAADGPLERTQAVFDHGRLVASHIYRQIAAGPGGGDVLKTSVLRPDARSHVERIGAALRWHGALSFDYIVDKKSGAPLFFDANPRLVEPMNAWLSGVDLAGALLRVSLGETPPAELQSREGVITRLGLMGLLDAASRRGRRGDVLWELTLLTCAAGRYRGTEEELVPLLTDPHCIVPLAVVLGGLLMSPTSGASLSRRTVDAYSLTPAAIARLRRGAIMVVALLLGLINALSFSRALERMTLSIAYPTFSGASIVLTLLVSVIAFNEPIDPLKLFGVFIIIAGPINTADGRIIFGEALEICQRDDGALWGQSLCGPMLLIAWQDRSAVANRPDTGGVLVKTGDNLFSGTVPENQVLANTPVEWSGVRWTQLLFPLPEDEAERRVLLAHEMFHRIQPGLGLTRAERGNRHLDSLEGRYLLQLEWRALERALLASTGRDRDHAIGDALTFRHARYKLFPNAQEDEAALQISEGVAEYTGVRLGLATPEARTAYAVRNLSAFVSAPTFIRSFAYASGAAYGLLLDQILPDWKDRIRAGARVDDLLAEGLAWELAGAGRASSRASAYDADGALRAVEERREVERLQRVAGWRARLVDGPVFVLPLDRARYEFNPQTLQALDEYGTVYPTMRTTDAWGALVVEDGALLDAQGRHLAVSAAGIDLDTLSGAGWPIECLRSHDRVPLRRGVTTRTTGLSGTTRDKASFADALRTSFCSGPSKSTSRTSIPNIAMPKIDVATVPARKGAGYPPPFNLPCADRVRQRLGDAGGLTDFGVNLMRLPPGNWSSQRHWHSHEDEFIYVLEGELTLIEDGGESVLRAGECAAFAKGSGNGHHLINNSDAMAVYLEVGMRAPADVTICSDIDMMSTNADGRFVHKDGEPYATP